MNRDNFDGSIYDPESELQMMGNSTIENYVTIQVDSPHKNYMIIAHEFAHAIQKTIAGIDFDTYSSDLKEHYAANAENSLRNFHGAPLIYYEHGFSVGWFNKTFYPKTWGKYLKRGY